MRVSVYKWSQYYLMYSPIWRQLINSPIQRRLDLNKLDINNKRQQPNRNKYTDIQQYISINSRLSVAYRLLIKYKQNDHVSLNSNKVVDDSMDDKYRRCYQYWLKQREQIRRKLYKIMQVITIDKRQFNGLNNEGSRQRRYSLVSQMIDDLFIMSSSDGINIETNSHGQQSKPSNQQNKIQHQFQQQQQNDERINNYIKGEQGQQQQKQPNNYNIDQVHKRLLLAQLSQLLYQQQNSMGNQDQSISYQHIINTGESKLVIIIMKRLLGNKLLQISQEEQLIDWLTVIVQETQIIQQINNATHHFLENCILNNIQHQRLSFTEMNKLMGSYFQLGQIRQSIVPNLIKSIKNNKNQKINQSHEISTLLKSLTSNIKLISQNEHMLRSTRTNVSKLLSAYQICERQVRRLYSIKKTIRKCIRQSKEVCQVQQFDDASKQIQIVQKVYKNTLIDFSNSNQNSISKRSKRPVGKQSDNKSVNTIQNNKQQDRVSFRYILYRLSLLIKTLQQLRNSQLTGSGNNPQSMNRLYKLIIQEIQLTFAQVHQIIGSDRANSIQDVIYLAVMSKNLLRATINTSTDDSELVMTVDVYKTIEQIQQYCTQIILNYDLTNAINQNQSRLPQYQQNPFNGKYFCGGQYDKSSDFNKVKTVSSKGISLLYSLLIESQYEFMGEYEDCWFVSKDILNQNGYSIIPSTNKSKYLPDRLSLLKYSIESQFLIRVVKQLQKHLIIQKEHILLSNNQKEQLKQVVQFIDHNIKQLQLSNQLIQSLNKLKLK